MKPLSKKFVERLRVVADRLGTRREAADIAGVTVDAIIRYLRGENQPSFTAISKLCEAAGVSMQWLATGEGGVEANDSFETSASRGFPVTGFAESKDVGWYNPQASRIQTTLDMPDPKAFAVVVHGQGLIPEGLHPGFLCVCSPMLKPAKGDIVHLRRTDGLCTMKLFVGEEKEWLILKAYTDADAKGGQRPFEDKVKHDHRDRAGRLRQTQSLSKLQKQRAQIVDDHVGCNRKLRRKRRVFPQNRKASGGNACAYARGAVLDHEAFIRTEAEFLRREEITFGVGLGIGHVVGAD
jgi:transcriptional regulator with XRE-family HTH domain